MGPLGATGKREEGNFWRLRDRESWVNEILRLRVQSLQGWPFTGMAFFNQLFPFDFNLGERETEEGRSRDTPLPSLRFIFFSRTFLSNKCMMSSSTCTWIPDRNRAHC